MIACKRRLAWVIQQQRVCAERCLSSVRSASARTQYLEKHLSSIEFSRNPYELEQHGRGEGPYRFETSKDSLPDAVAFPRSVQDVQAIMAYCIQERIPIIPFGAGTSLEGHVGAPYGGLSLDMKYFDQMELPTLEGEDLSDPLAKVGAGVTRKTLNQALRHTGLQFTVDPGADASLGGMVATGASGTTTVRYGGMRDNLLELECVLATQDGPKVVRTGTRALKNSAGYDLLSLLCGSEGTLGIITSVTVQLHPIAAHTVAAVVMFDDLPTAGRAVAALRWYGTVVNRCELLDASSVDAFNQFNAHNPQVPQRSARPTLFLEFEGPDAETVHQQAARVGAFLTEDFQASPMEFATSEPDRLALWSARHTLYNASIALRPGAEGTIVTDSCVPLRHFADVMHSTAADVERLGVVGPCFGHAGDGNLHCLMPIRSDDSEDYRNRVQEVQERLIERTLRVGGTCTGEHGVGVGKIPYLERQYGPAALDAMRAIKQALDPHNIMNPGKIVRHV